MSTLEALYQRYKERGLEVLAVNLDLLSSAGVAAFLQEVGVTFLVGLDPAWSTAQAYRGLGLPTTYLIDRTGYVVVVRSGRGTGSMASVSWRWRASCNKPRPPCAAARLGQKHGVVSL